MSDKLPILLSAQIASDGLRVECIGMARGIVTGMWKDRHKTYEEACDEMYADAISQGGEVVIDPQMQPTECTHYYSVAMFCRVGRFVKDEAEGRSEE
jgi:hypothetical protein